jgi:hypothetical protein
VSPLEKNRQRASELLARLSQPRGLDLHVIPQHRLLGIWMKVHLLVHPLWHRMPLVANPSYGTGLKRQDLINLTTRMPNAKSLVTRLETVPQVQRLYRP